VLSFPSILFRSLRFFHLFFILLLFLAFICFFPLSKWRCILFLLSYYECWLWHSVPLLCGGLWQRSVQCDRYECGPYDQSRRLISVVGLRALGSLWSAQPALLQYLSTPFS
jgi:hypothetical protein